MGGLYLQDRLDLLRRAQNTDGGWGYFPGKQSWMEPTVYAMLALQGRAEAAAALDRAFQRVQAWQLPDGSWRPGGGVADPSWVTALGVLLVCCRGNWDARAEQGVGWLLDTRGSESRWTVQIAAHLHLLKTNLNVDHPGWPWRPGTSAWIEPTSLTVLSLKKTLLLRPSRAVAARAHDGEELIFSRRDRDGGWNSGNPNVLRFDLPSYPETTALALLGLQGRSSTELADALAGARDWHRRSKSSLATAWLTIALRCHGQTVGTGPDRPALKPDILVTALEAMAAPEGNWGLFRTETTA